VACRRAPATIRRAFTLLELLVVLLVIATIAGLAIGSMLRMPTANRLLGTEHLVADMIRQARHTARSSGGPVLVLISRLGRDNSDAGSPKPTISGVSRICVVSETFEAISSSGGAINEADRKAQAERLAVSGRSADFTQGGSVTETFRMPGHAGLGWLLADTQGRSEGLIRPLPIEPDGTQATLDIRNPLMRRQGDGFYLQAAIKPPTVGASGATVHVIKVGENDSQAAFTGIELNRKTVAVQTSQFDAGEPAVSITQSYWTVDGWLGSDTVSSENTTTPTITLPSGQRDSPAPISGDEWLTVGLLFDGRNLVLYRNGNEVDRKVIGARTPVLGLNVFLGREDGVNGRGVIDSAAVYRLGVDQVGSLPAGIVPKQDYRITCQPDGRVEVEGGNQLEFDQAGINAQQVRRATITVASDGRVTSRIEIQK